MAANFPVTAGGVCTLMRTSPHRLCWIWYLPSELILLVWTLSLLRPLSATNPTAPEGRGSPLYVTPPLISPVGGEPQPATSKAASIAKAIARRIQALINKLSIANISLGEWRTAGVSRLILAFRPQIASVGI